MYSVYLRWHDDSQRIEQQTRTGNREAALAAYRAILGRDDLAGQRVAAVLRDQGAKRTLLFSRYDDARQRLLPADPIGLPVPGDDADAATRAIVAARVTAPEPMDTPELLKRYRARHGWTQGAAARECGVAERTWERWEAGASIPQPVLLGRLLREAMGLAT